MDQAYPVLRELLERCQRDHAAWINGDGTPYALPDDGTIMGAVGGFSFGGDATAEQQRAVAAQWRSGTGNVELVNGGVDGDLAWIATIERATVNFAADPPEVQRRWDLRATEVFRRTADGWQRVHRQADPLVDRRPVTEVADLLE
jgi:ketosteroid isomerase-like protein